MQVTVTVITEVSDVLLCRTQPHILPRRMSKKFNRNDSAGVEDLGLMFAVL